MGDGGRTSILISSCR